MEVEYKLMLPEFPGYRICNDGSCWSAWSKRSRGYGSTPGWYITDPPEWKGLSGGIRKQDGRRRYTLRSSHRKYVHLDGGPLVLTYFVGPCPDGMETCHNDGDCTNNRLTNLRWDTSAGNKADMLAHGTRLSGEKHPMAKLTWDKVRAIRRAYMGGGGGFTLKQIAKQYAVEESVVCDIVNNKRWKDEIDYANAT